VLVWPNADSWVNSDPWLVEHHDELTLMRPRVLVVNYVHGFTQPQPLLNGLIAALRESSRWQGRGPVFLEYEIAEIVDLTEPRGDRDRNSARFPREPNGLHLDYAAMYEQAGLAAREDINEVWLLADHTDHTWPWETVEVKRSYARSGFERYAGNSGEHTAPWLGRSLRTLFINFARGVGCAMESLGHSLERMATCGAIPDYERYFREYAGLDLDRRYGLPFESLYAAGRVAYPSADTLEYKQGWRRRRLQPWIPAGGNVHFMPNGRFDYDLDGDRPVLSTIETWRQPGEEPRPWTPAVLEPYRELADDCMGRWVLYWRQHMPGLGNTALDDDGRPMKNWWPYLFY
jgi:hypothetical protein